MATRPGKPGSDLKGIWQTLLPGTPMPACGTQDKPGAKANEAEPDKDKLSRHGEAAAK